MTAVEISGGKDIGGRLQGTAQESDTGIEERFRGVCLLWWPQIWEIARQANARRRDAVA